ncbi:AEC family transporter [Colwellia echini]|uniref:AEC family transporter n=1 Tax=Colwellia echini TaxID=1982103 RepID=A0ABY3MWK2_9GAMM|nr:AEC family transporter [Colwellia echini]TYK65457.1 AEC family transporter [Colwellia echini]
MFSELLSTVNFAFSVTGPIFTMVVLGGILKYYRLIGDVFISQASIIVFKVSLPVLLGMSMIKTDIATVFDPVIIASAGLATLLVFVLLTLSASLFVKNPRDKGVYVQGAFRGNLAIVGLAFCANLYGAEGIAKASILMSILVLMYNVLCIYTLTTTLTDKKLNISSILVSIVKNPLIIGIVLGISINLLHIPIHPVLMKTGDYLAQLTLPVALLCIGASLSFNDMKSTKMVASASVIAKLIVTPIIITSIGYACGYSKMELGILFLMASTPTAAASFVMVKAMKGNETLAANIIVMSTVGSLFTVSVGLAFLKSFDLI